MALEDVTNEERSKLGRLIKPMLVATGVTTGIAAAGTIAILAYSISANRDVPKQLWNMAFGNQRVEQYAPVSPPIVFTPAPKINPLAVIRAYQPDLAEIIERQGWFKDGLDTKEEASLSELGKKVSADTGYLPDKLTLDGAEKDIAILYDKGLESRAQEAATYLKAVLPKIQEFFGLPVGWSILFVQLNQLEEGQRKSAGGGTTGGIAGFNVDNSNWSLLEHSIGHEGTHMVVDQNFSGSPIWYNESLADIGRYISTRGSAEEILSIKESVNPPPDWPTKPLSEFTLDDHLGTNGKGGTTEHISRGEYLLLKYRAFAGHDAFQQFIGDVDLIKRSRELTNEDIREKMLLHTPDEFKTKVATMYDAEVYGK